MSQKIAEMLGSPDGEVFLLGIHLALALPEEECLGMFRDICLADSRNTRKRHWFPTIITPSFVARNIIYKRGNIGICTTNFVMCKRMNEWSGEFLERMNIIDLDK